MLAVRRKSAFGAGKVIQGCHHFTVDVEHVEVKTIWNLRKFVSFIYSPHLFHLVYSTHLFIHQQIHKERLLNARFRSGDSEQKTEGSALMMHTLPIGWKDSMLINAFKLDEGALRKVRLGNVTESMLRRALV